MAGGNPDLNSQETVAYDIGADHYFTPAIKTSASYFYNDIKNLIERIQDPETSDRYYANVGEATIEGLEFAFDYQAFDSLSFGTNYTYLSTSDDTNNTHLLYRPRHKIGFDTRYNYSILYANLQASYSTGAYEGNGTVQSPGFFLINASVEIDLTSKMIEDFIIRDASLFLKGYNLFDKNYYEGLDYQAGRSLLLGLNVKF
jgi:iron complex outermembrane receptor protein/outer membrane receptor for ferrienterochelin and colicins